MSDYARRITLLLLLLTIGLTALVAAGLPRLELKPGLPFPSADNQPGELAPLPEEAPGGGSLRAVFGLGILLGLLLLYLVYKLVTGVPWKEVVQPSIFFGLLLLTITGLLFSLLIWLSPRGTGSDEALLPAAPDPLVTGPLGDPPAGLIWLVWAGLAVLAAFLGIGLVRWTRTRPAPDRLALEADLALQALRDGLDFKSVIVRCYQQMSQALQEEQGLEREEAMTAREFERLLAARGVPARPVEQLTRLFEAVRYGHRPPTQADEQLAYESLTAILDYSRKQPPERQP